MTAAAYLVLRCDHPGCDTEHGTPLPVFTAAELRAALKRNGWRRRRRGAVLVDLCPTHARRAPAPLTDDERRAILDALTAGNYVVHTARCDACQTMQCPGGDHPWYGPEDIAHAARTGQEPPSGTCGCHCAKEPQP